MKSRRRYMAAQ